MEDWAKHPILVLAALVAVVVVDIANFKLGTDPAVVRPHPWTSIQADEAHNRLSSVDTSLSNQIQENRDDIDRIREQLVEHRVTAAHGVVVDRLDKLERRIERLELK